VAFARAGIRRVAYPALDNARTIASAEKPTSNAPFYFNVRRKFAFSLSLSVAWLALTIVIALPWVHDLSLLMGAPLAWLAIGGMAFVPGFMNAFLITSLLLDRRPARQQPSRYPPLSILIAAYNEEPSIADTLRSIANQDYPGVFEVFVVDDGSTDRTAAIVDACDLDWLKLLRQPANAGKSAALNRGLEEARFDLVVTLDADSYLHRGALKNLVERYLNDPPNTRAVAGTMLVRNSRKNWVTKAQEWDYFHGIAAIKRVQSLYQGTLVAQGAFSLYERATLKQVGGWVDCAGEDIVLTWAMLREGWRVGHAEDALCFTNAPDNLHQFVRQRQRWARGVIQAFRQFPDILLKPRLSTMFVWWSLLFPWLDLAYTLFFIPGRDPRAVRHLLDRGTPDAGAAADGARHQLHDVSRRLADVHGERAASPAQRVGIHCLCIRLQPDSATRLRRGLLPRNSRPPQERAHEVICALVAALASCLAWHTSYNRSTRCVDAPDYALSRRVTLICPS
jgi:biofilm PGA synthesis N-glycosyltransferase PgaC